MSDAQIGPDSLRLSDAERETASQALGEHFAQGRLDADEHAERHERMWTAKTRGDIPPLFADLPGGSPLHPAPRAQPRAAARRPAVGRAVALPPAASDGHPLPVKIAFGIVVAVLVITHWWLVLIALGVAWMLSHRGDRRGRRSQRATPATGAAARAAAGRLPDLRPPDGAD